MAAKGFGALLRTWLRTRNSAPNLQPKSAPNSAPNSQFGFELGIRRGPQVVAAYRERRFQDAHELATAYDAGRPGGDAAARLYAERSARLLAAPPAADWDPTHVLTEK